MKTTFLTNTPSDRGRNNFRDISLLIIHLILIVNYLIAIILLLFYPGRHGYGGGITLTQPSFLLLFSLLVFIHLILSYNRWFLRIIHFAGVGLVITVAMTLGLLLISRQAMNLIQSIYPIPLLLTGSLGISLLIGIYLVTRIFSIRDRNTTLFSPEKNSLFPLPEDRYKNFRVIGEGGVGTIWYAERASDGMQVAVKVPRSDDEKTGMSFLQEISLWKDLSHPNIVSVLSVNILPLPYMEMEYLPCSLEIINKPVSLFRAEKIILGLVSALMYAHERGIAHCDIKPTNILLTDEGVPKLTDWGLSRSESSRWAVFGFSPHYAAPEQSRNPPECSPATDIWQIGLIFAELLTDRAEKPSGKEPVFLQPDGAAILPLIQRCLSADPLERYPSAQALHEDLRHLFLSEKPDL